MVDQELADLIPPGITRTSVHPHRGVIPRSANVFLAASQYARWKEAADVVAQPVLAAAQLREITDVLASP
ncbi:hypothetical protein [Streptomyces violaceus]|uniref:Uncharacterized protein n=1 Tax=Streptomyces violaceus TaxID=1936 RepID=A0ABY9U0V8_STRVL|nr:hypothetical protein [Streptomyces janthinus]WND15983.1 hypothetical protein RI060_00795 [Streptomyces janthinus]